MDWLRKDNAWPLSTVLRCNEAGETQGINVDINSNRIGLLDLKTKTLYEQMRPYYMHIASERVATPLLTVPYFDDNVKEPMIAISIPAFHRHRFIGVVGTAMSLRELVIQQKSDFSYVYVIRLSDGAVLYHPMLHIPTDGDDDSVMLNIRVLEREADDNGVHDSMRRCGDDPT
ncbi:hypothetical protein LSAT2_014284 [Lamellibrachia satsuma]|nr:hypothetical protein LSAT2_014284 [Lamellibrachia satsuma]